MNKILDNIKNSLFNNKKKKHKELPFKVVVKSPDYIDDKDLVIHRFVMNESSSSIVSKIMKKGKSKFICTEFGNIVKYTSPDNNDNIYYTSFKKSHLPHYVCKISKLKQLDDDTILERILFMTENDYIGCDKFLEDLESEKSIYTKGERVIYTKSYINFENKIKLSCSNNENQECMLDFYNTITLKDAVIERKIKQILKIFDNNYKIKPKCNDYVKIINSTC